MGKYGGQLKYGSGHFGGDRSPTTQGYVISRMIAAMAPRMTKTSSSQPLKTVARLYGDPRQRATWDAVLTTGGLPAVLVHYPSGLFAPKVTSGARFDKTITLDVYCIANDFRSLEHRVEGKHYNDGAAEQIAAWVVYYMTRALGELTHVRDARPVSELPFFFDANAVGYVVRFTGTQSLAVYDAAIALKLDTLGICHTPIDSSALFESNNVTPRSEDEPLPATNVADLTE